jgi:predicted aspartyl protease
MHRLLLVLALAWLGACEAPVVPDSAEACRVERLTSVPMREAGGLWVVDVQIHGKPATLMLDTGANNVLLLPEAVKRLNIRIDSNARYAVTAAGGTTVFRRALEIDEMAIGSERIEHLRFPELEGAHWAERGYDGILGMTAFARFDVEIDFPAKTLSLYRRRFCPSGAPPWRERHASFPATARGSSQGSPMAPAQLDGQRGRALLDTGASLSVVDSAFARRAGGGEVPASGPRNATAHTVGDAPATLGLRRFRELRVAGMRFTSPHLWVGQLGDRVELLLGLDVLARTRIWISHGSDRVHLAVPPEPAAK